MNLEPPTNLNDCMELIEKTLKENPDDRIYLLIHNIDGPMLRSSKVQDKLSYLASFPNLHLVASVDHINASLCKISKHYFYFKFNYYVFILTFNFIFLPVFIYVFNVSSDLFFFQYGIMQNVQDTIFIGVKRQHFCLTKRKLYTKIH